jgi:hypothetical protein
VNAAIPIDACIELAMVLEVASLMLCLYAYYCRLVVKSKRRAKFQRVCKEVNELPTKAYADYQFPRPRSEFLSVVYVLVSVFDDLVHVYLFVCHSFPIFDFRCILDDNVGCYSCVFKILWMCIHVIHVLFMCIQDIIDASVAGFVERKHRKTLSPSSDLFCDSVLCRFV